MLCRANVAYFVIRHIQVDQIPQVSQTSDVTYPAVVVVSAQIQAFQGKQLRKRLEITEEVATQIQKPQICEMLELLDAVNVT